MNTTARTCSGLFPSNKDASDVELLDLVEHWKVWISTTVGPIACLGLICNKQALFIGTIKLKGESLKLRIYFFAFTPSLVLI